MWRFYEGVKDIPRLPYMEISAQKSGCAIMTLNIGEYDSSGSE